MDQAKKLDRPVSRGITVLLLAGCARQHSTDRELPGNRHPQSGTCATGSGRKDGSGNVNGHQSVSMGSNPEQCLPVAPFRGQLSNFSREPEGVRARQAAGLDGVRSLESPDGSAPGGILEIDTQTASLTVGVSGIVADCAARYFEATLELCGRDSKKPRFAGLINHARMTAVREDSHHRALGEFHRCLNGPSGHLRPADLTHRRFEFAPSQLKQFSPHNLRRLGVPSSDVPDYRNSSHLPVGKQ
jgi:hypothetical protein